MKCVCGALAAFNGPGRFKCVECSTKLEFVSRVHAEDIQATAWKRLVAFKGPLQKADAIVISGFTDTRVHTALFMLRPGEGVGLAVATYHNEKLTVEVLP